MVNQTCLGSRIPKLTGQRSASIPNITAPIKQLVEKDALAWVQVFTITYNVLCLIIKAKQLLVDFMVRHVKVQDNHKAFFGYTVLDVEALPLLEVLGMSNLDELAVFIKNEIEAGICSQRTPSQEKILKVHVIYMKILDNSACCGSDRLDGSL